MDKKHISKIYHNGDTLYVKDAEARETMVSGVSYDTTNKKIVETINGVNSDVVSLSTIKSDLNLTKSDVSLSNVTNDAQVKRTEMGVASGVATLDSAGKVPASQLPSYVDDVVEYASRSAFPETGETGKIYVDIAANETYRWSGSQYVIISDSQVQANWNTTDATSKSYIQNKPTNVSSFTNDAGYLTQHQDISGKADKTSTVSDVVYDGTNKKITKTINGTTSDVVTSEKVVEDGGGMNLVEGYYYNKKFYKEAAHTTEITGADGRIYIDKDTNREYRFDGTKYVLLKSEVDGSFVSEGTFIYRPTAGALDVESGAVGEGGAQIECVKGNTIAWNQLISTKNAASSYTLYGVTFTKNLDGLISISGTATTADARYYLGTTRRQMLPHKYLLKQSKPIADTTSAYDGVDVMLYINDNYVSDIVDNFANGIIFDNTNGTYTSYVISVLINTLQAYNASHIFANFIDLTLIYGEGNEPTTPEQFEADYQKWFGKPLTYEEYDAGSLRSVEMTGIKTVGFNQWDEEYEEGVINSDGSFSPGSGRIASANFIQILPSTTYCFKKPTGILQRQAYYDSEKNFISFVDLFDTSRSGGTFITPYNARYMKFYVSTYPYNHDICINLSHSGDKNGDYEPYWEHTASLPVTQLKGKLNGEGESVVIFPYGMKKAGDVYDEIVKRGNQTVAIKRVGSVDLGNFNFGAVETMEPEKNRWMSLSAISNVKANTQNLLFFYGRYASTYECKQGVTLNSDNSCIIYIEEYRNSDAATFKTAMSGVMLYYELEAPQEYIIDDIDFPTEYPVDDYGTEEILSDSAKSLAPTLDIRYGLNATDTLRNLPSKYVSAVEEQNFTDAQKERARNNIGINNIDNIPTQNSNNLVLSKGVYDSISDLQTQIDNIDDGYGIQWTNVNTSPVRIGNMKLHRTLPIQSKMRRYIKTANGIKKFISDTDYTKYEDGTTVNYQSDGELFVVVPKYWYTADKKVVDGVNQYSLTLYNRHVAGAKESKEVHISAVEASSDDATNGTPSLYSIIKANIVYNNDGSVDASNLTYAEDAANYRGGNQRSSSSWDEDSTKCQLGRPVTSLTRAAFRERAARRGTGYSQQYWTAYMAWVRLYVVEYCSFNSLASYNENKTTEGYMQGGLGAGVSQVWDWDNLNGYNPVNPCGVTIRLGNKTGVVAYTQGSYTMYVPSYRGIENPFGNIWKWTDGLNQHDTEIYVCDDITKFADDTSTGYELRGNCATGGWITDVIWDENGEFIPSAVGGSDSSYYHDYMWYAEGWRVLDSGGRASYGSYDGLFCFPVDLDSSDADAVIGGRLYYTPDNN